MPFSECRVIKGTQTPALPNISVHPNGNMLTWAGEGGINIMHLTNCSRVSCMGTYQAQYFKHI